MDTAGWSGVRDWRVTLRALGSRSVLLPPSRERLVGAVVVAAVGLSLATWICSVFVGDKAPLAIPALTYLMAVLLVSVVGRLVVGFVAALVAAALMAYYFAPPYHTFAIDDGTIIGSTIAFLLVAGFASLLITGESWSRQTADDARRRLGLIAEASGELTETLDERRALQVLAELATKTMADYCVVDVLENGELRRTVVAVSFYPASSLCRGAMTFPPLSPSSGGASRTGYPSSTNSTGTAPGGRYAGSLRSVKRCS